MLPDLENCDCDQEQEAERQNSTRSCPGSFAASVTRHTQFPRRSLKELRIDVSKNLEPFVQRRAKYGLERITEDPISPGFAEDTPIAPPRMHRARIKDVEPSIATGDPPRSNTPASCSSDPPMSERSVVERIEETLHTHYYTIAYTLVIVAYLVGFAEYVYYRLVSILIPENVAYHPSCQAKHTLRVGKDGFHYGVSIGAFIAIALFQLICFFALTISENWTVCRTEYNPLNQIVKMQHDLAAHIRKTISQSMYRTFLCYGICSFINCGIIFYMVAIQDSLGDTVSRVLTYVFDGVVILYFIAFPLTTVIYHPHVHCFHGYPTRAARLPSFLINGIRSQTSTLESNLSREGPPPPPPQNLAPENLPSLEQPENRRSPSLPVGSSTLV